MSRFETTIAFVAALAVSPPAFAYLDPSTGSMILSAIVGLLATLGLALKTFWYRIRGWFRRAPDRDDTKYGGPESGPRG